MKICRICLIKKPYDQFGVKANNKDGLNSMCFICCREYGRVKHKENAIVRRQQIEKSRLKNREYCRQKFWEILSTGSCMDCGICDPEVMDFDHQGDKKYDVADMVTKGSYSWEKIKLEIDKCHMVCANCHRRRTNRQFGRWRFGYVLTNEIA